ncbi:MAG: tRNA (guanine(10)-N(2))-dimethyltransferase [Methanoregula sp.]|nr:MAG: tRNA (guanine(10)-N(2))-dimethyltransferase [Methanoregula sp.]
MELVEATEGRTAFFVPVQDATTSFPPNTGAVFFNRRMELNRDATVLFCTCVEPAPKDYLDAMGATGVRGIRIARECGVHVTINDRDPEAIALIEKNIEHTGLPIEFVRRDARALLSERRFDAVDIDPFGTPAPFADAGIRGARRYLFLTATDTAPLCGAHLKAGMRRYFATPRNTEFHAEVGLRVLLGFAARETIKYDRGIEPLFCFAREHFFRLHLRLVGGARAADRTLARIGFVLQCKTCPYRKESPGIIAEKNACPHCGGLMEPIGPLWLGSINDRPLLARMQERIEGMELGTKKDLTRLLAICAGELDTSSHYDYHVFAKWLSVSPPEITTVIGRLASQGFAATRTHYSGYGIKTDAPVDAISAAIRDR